MFVVMGLVALFLYVFSSFTITNLNVYIDHPVGLIYLQVERVFRVISYFNGLITLKLNYILYYTLPLNFLTFRMHVLYLNCDYCYTLHSDVKFVVNLDGNSNFRE